MKTVVFFLSCSLFLFSCGQTGNKIVIQQHDTTIAEPSKKISVVTNDSIVIKDGEYIVKYDNGAVKIKGIMKAGKREGTWNSFYSNGTPWSESSYIDGKKNGKTTTWYENGQKRYEGFYTFDEESGVWTNWDEKGKLLNSEDHGKK